MLAIAAKTEKVARLIKALAFGYEHLGAVADDERADEVRQQVDRQGAELQKEYRIEPQAAPLDLLQKAGDIDIGRQRIAAADQRLVILVMRPALPSVHIDQMKCHNDLLHQMIAKMIAKRKKAARGGLLYLGSELRNEV